MKLPHTSTLAAKLGAALAPKRLLPGLAAGLIAGIIAVTVSTAFAALVFTGPLTAYVFPGIGIMLCGSLIIGLVTALTSSLPGLVAGLQDSTVVIMTLIAANITRAMDASAPPETVFLTVAVAIALSSLITGVIFLLLGAFNLGTLIRYIPYPVIGGFLGGSGLLLVFGALAVMIDQPLSLLQLTPLFDLTLLGQWLPGLMLAVILLVAVRRSEHPLTVPGVLTAAALVFFGWLTLTRTSIADATTAGWFLQSLPTTQGGLWRPLPLSALQRVDWQALVSQAGNLGVISVISVINLLLNATGIEIATHHDSDLNHELRITGLANILAGLGGGMGGSHVLSDSTLAHRMGASTRLVGMFLAAVCGLVLLLGGQLLALFPTPILGGLLLFLGLDFLITWVYEVRFRLPTFDYAIILIILVMINAIGVLEGVSLGLALAVVLFVVEYSRVGVVRHALSGADYQSYVDRPQLYQQLLRQKGEWLYILKLQGFLFFGTANTLLEQVRARLADTTRVKPRFIVLDFQRVNGLDASAVLVFTRIVQLAEAHNLTLVVTQLSAKCRHQLARDVFKDESGAHWRIFPDLDHGLEWCEDCLIAVFEEVGLTAKPHKAKQRLENALARTERLGTLLNFMAAAGMPATDHTCTLLGELNHYLEQQEIQTGALLIRAGEPSHGLYFLEAGTFAVEIEDHQGRAYRLRKLQAGTTVGELGMYLGTKASASIVATSPGTVYYLSRKNLLRMECDDPALAAAFHKFIAQCLSARVANTTRTLQALLD